MKKTRRLALIFTVLFTIISSFSFVAFATENSSPQKSMNVVVNTNLTGWIFNDGYWYYIDENGDKKTGWIFDVDAWYFLDSEGRMRTGWVSDNGKWYYMNNKGKMQTGWLFEGNSWYYLATNGEMCTGWTFDGNEWYYLQEDGRMYKGWLEQDGTWYFLDGDSGKMFRGYHTIGNVLYFFDNSSGEMHTGVFFDGENHRIATDDGAVYQGCQWVKYHSDWYRTDKDGLLVQGWLFDNGWYYTDDSFKMLTGFIAVDGETYYMNSSGLMQTGWQFMNNYWYYFAPSGEMSVNEITTVDNKEYGFDEEGHMLTGWAILNGEYRFFKPNGELQSTWRRSDETGTAVDAQGNQFTYHGYMIGSCTAYTAQPGAKTSTGLDPQYGYIAVDPKIIPYHTQMYVVAENGSVVYGHAVAEDTGGAMMSGNRLADLYYNTEAECWQFGVRDMIIYFL